MIEDTDDDLTARIARELRARADPELSEYINARELAQALKGDDVTRTKVAMRLRDAAEVAELDIEHWSNCRPSTWRLLPTEKIQKPQDVDEGEPIADGGRDIRRVSTRYPEQHLEGVEQLVDLGAHSNQSEVFRAAVKQYLESHDAVTQAWRRLRADGGDRR